MYKVLAFNYCKAINARWEGRFLLHPVGGSLDRRLRTHQDIRVDVKPDDGHASQGSKQTQGAGCLVGC